MDIKEENISSYLKYYYNEVDTKITFEDHIYDLYYENYMLYIKVQYGNNVSHIQADRAFSGYRPATYYTIVEEHIIKPLVKWYKQRYIEYIYDSHNIAERYFGD